MLRKNGYIDEQINKSSSKVYIKQSAKVNFPTNDTTERNIYLKQRYSKASHLNNDIVNEMNPKISRHSIKINEVHTTMVWYTFNNNYIYNDITFVNRSLTLF